MAVIEEVSDDVSLLALKSQVHEADAPAQAWDSDEEIENDEIAQESSAQTLYEEIEDAQLPESIAFTLDLTTWSIPFLFAFELLNLVVQKQYSQDVTFLGEGVMLVLGTVAGCYMAYLVNRAPYKIAMARAPAVGTLWIFTVVRMDLAKCVLSLLVFGAYLLYAGYRLVL